MTQENLLWNIAEIYDSLADVYDDHFSDPESLQENKTVQRILWKLHHQQDRILDLGCGTGFLLDLLYCKNYTGIDISHKMLERARKKYPNQQFLYVNMEAMNCIADKSKDMVVSTFGGISYAHPEHTAQEIERVTHRGSRIMLMFFKENYAHRPTYILKVYRKNDGYYKLNPTQLRKLYAVFHPQILQLPWFYIVVGVKE